MEPISLEVDPTTIETIVLGHGHYDHTNGMHGLIVEAIASFDPTYLVPAHCSGFRATHALAERLPEALIPNTVGTVYTF